MSLYSFKYKGLRVLYFIHLQNAYKMADITEMYFLKKISDATTRGARFVEFA
jgi:hypothetical protein